MLAALNEKRQSIGRNFAVENLAQAFLSAALTQKDIFLVLDAPDELESPKEVVSLLQSFVKAGCKVCVFVDPFQRPSKSTSKARAGMIWRRISKLDLPKVTFAMLWLPSTTLLMQSFSKPTGCFCSQNCFWISCSS